MIVLDASAALSALLNAGAARRDSAGQQLHVPHVVDSEVAGGLRRRVAAGDVSAGAAWTALRVWQRLGMTRYPVCSLLHRVWELRENVAPNVACSVALAELLGTALLSADARLARAPGIRCPVTVVPR